MPSIDTSAIEGFDGMSADEKVAALLKLEIPEAVDMSKFVSKETFDKKASEAATLSKQLRDKMTEDEQKKADDEKVRAEMQEELKNLRRDKTVSEYTAKYIALGYDKELAEATAKAMADGDMKTVFENGEKHRAALEKRIKADLMRGTPNPNGGNGDDGKDPVVEAARARAKARGGNGKQYDETLKHYM